MKGSYISVEINGMFYKSINCASKTIKYADQTIKRRCLSNKFSNYKIIPFNINPIKKRCSECGKTKLIKEFSKSISDKDGYRFRCKQCHNEYNKRRRKQQYVKNRNNERAKERRKTDIAFKANEVMRDAIRVSLKDGKNGRHWETLTSYTCEELIKHLESLFTEGMTWENHGKGKDRWNLDHIIAISKWNIASYDCQEFRDCWALDNLQPLWQLQNFKKGNRPMHPKYLIKPGNILTKKETL